MAARAPATERSVNFIFVFIKESVGKRKVC
jgi:hypothetical protein